MTEKKKELLNIQLASFDNESPYPDRKKGLFFIHDFDFNRNGLKIPEELASEYLDSLNGSPLVAKYDPKKDDITDHQAVKDKKGKIVSLNTDAVGVLFDAHIGTHEFNGEEKYGVWAEGYLWLRFENTLNAIQNLFDENSKVDVSVEVQIGGYEFSEDGRIAQNYLNYFGTALLGGTVSPAYADAGLYALNNLEVASAFEQDINSPTGGVNVAELNQASKAEVRETMNKMLQKMSKIMMSKKQMKQVMDEINETDVEALSGMCDVMLSHMGDSNYFDFYIPEEYVYDNHLAAYDYYTRKSFLFDYSVDENGNVSLANPRPCRFQPVEINEMVEDGLIKEISELFTKNHDLSSQLESKTKELEDKVTEFNSLVEEKGKLETKVNELSQVKTEEEIKDETIIKLNTQLNELNGKIEKMQPLIDEYNKIQEDKRIAELNAKKDELKEIALNSKVITAEDLEIEEFKNYIEELNEDAINKIIVKRICELNSIEEPELKKNENGDVVIATTEPKDLIPGGSVCSKYGINN